MSARDKELLKEAGYSFGQPFDLWCQRVADLIRADEREACAKVCDELQQQWRPAGECADAIRARENT